MAFLTSVFQIIKIQTYKIQTIEMSFSSIANRTQKSQGRAKSNRFETVFKKKTTNGKNVIRQKSRLLLSDSCANHYMKNAKGSSVCHPQFCSTVHRTNAEFGLLEHVQRKAQQVYELLLSFISLCLGLSKETNIV